MDKLQVKKNFIKKYCFFQHNFLLQSCKHHEKWRIFRLFCDKVMFIQAEKLLKIDLYAQKIRNDISTICSYKKNPPKYFRISFLNLWWCFTKLIIFKQCANILPFYTLMLFETAWRAWKTRSEGISWSRQFLLTICYDGTNRKCFFPFFQDFWRQNRNLSIFLFRCCFEHVKSADV